MSHEHRRFEAVRELVKDSEAQELRMLRFGAMAYAWGIQDASGDERDSFEASRFGDLYGEVVGLYLIGRIGTRPSIEAAYKRWSRGASLLPAATLARVRDGIVMDRTNETENLT